MFRVNKKTVSKVLIVERCHAEIKKSGQAINCIQRVKA